MAESWEVERLKRVRQMWQERYPAEKRTGANVLSLSLWLDLHRPELLNSENGDAYQRLKSDLNGLWND